MKRFFIPAFVLKTLLFFSLLFLSTITYASDHIMTHKTPPAPVYEKAILAGGCFWCLEADFDHLEGVIKTISGYTGGTLENPTYKDVSYKETGHYEALEVVYDPSKLSYEDILNNFWRNIDPFDDSGQFCDKGTQYRTAIFALNDAQYDIAIQSRAAKQKQLDKKIVTPILKASKFYAAEEHHQDYHNKNPDQYKRYRKGCARDAKTKAIWQETK